MEAYLDFLTIHLYFWIYTIFICFQIVYTVRSTNVWHLQTAHNFWLDVYEINSVEYMFGSSRRTYTPHMQADKRRTEANKLPNVSGTTNILTNFNWIEELYDHMLMASQAVNEQKTSLESIRCLSPLIQLHLFHFPWFSWIRDNILYTVKDTVNWTFVNGCIYQYVSNGRRNKAIFKYYNVVSAFKLIQTRLHIKMQSDLTPVHAQSYGEDGFTVACDYWQSRWFINWY